jgi:hypothetical protein
MALQRMAFAQVHDPNATQVIQNLFVEDRFTSINVNPKAATLALLASQDRACGDRQKDRHTTRQQAHRPILHW